MKNNTPQLENGYAQLSNELLEAFAKIKLSPNESQILWTVIRKTYGYHKKEDKISLTQFQAMTDLSRPSVAKAIKSLVAKQLLVAIQQPPINSYSLNKDYSTWLTSSYIDTSSRFTTPLVAKQLPKLVAKQQHTKDNKNKLAASAAPGKITTEIEKNGTGTPGATEATGTNPTPPTLQERAEALGLWNDLEQRGGQWYRISNGELIKNINNFLSWHERSAQEKKKTNSLPGFTDVSPAEFEKMTLKQQSDYVFSFAEAASADERKKQQLKKQGAIRV